MLLKIYDNQLTYSDLREVTQVLRDGGVIVYPTDSVYAFGCDAANKSAVETICRLREKDARNPDLSIVCNSISQVRQYAVFSNNVFKIMRDCLPGPFTFILHGNSSLPKMFRNKRTVGVRVPDHEVVHQILKELDHPMMTASLRIDETEDVEYMTDPELIYEKYANDVNLVLDAGIGQRVASTIIDCTGSLGIEIVRQGVGEIEL